MLLYISSQLQVAKESVSHNRVELTVFPAKVRWLHSLMKSHGYKLLPTHEESWALHGLLLHANCSPREPHQKAGHRRKPGV